MDSQFNYSIIIPHKNSLELLKKCVNSIPKRDDIQIIIIDDNSDSNNSNFNNFSDFANLILINLHGSKGAGAARNKGLNTASGKWIIFADADDIFINGFMEHIDKYKDSSYDLIYFGITRQGNYNEKKKNLYKEYDFLIRKALYKNKHDAYKYKAFFPWGKMIRHSLIKDNNITFDETIVANDIMFSVKTAYYSKNTFFDINKIYTYLAQNSQLTRIKSKESDFIRFCVYVNLNCFLKNINMYKYKKDLILPLKNLIEYKNMDYYYKAIKYVKESNINLFLELGTFLLLLPFKIINKLCRN